MKSLSGKVAIVTGASRGIGRAIALLLASHGANVVVNYANRSEQAEEVVEQIKLIGTEVLAVKADISKLDEIEALFQATMERFGRLDILVNNAGIMLNHRLEEVEEEEFNRHFAINVKGPFFCCQKAYSCMSEGGKIINFSTSMLGQMYVGYSVYAATKGAVEQITRQLAKEFAAKKITINAIAPGPTETEMFLSNRTVEQIEASRKNIALGRLGVPDDIASVVLFLASNDSHWICGQTIRVNGGFI